MFGSDAYVRIPDAKRRKLDPRSRKLTFVGYAEDQKGYRFLDRATDTITVSRDAAFIEWKNGSSQIEITPIRQHTVPNRESQRKHGTADEKSDDEYSDAHASGDFNGFDDAAVQEEKVNEQSRKQLPFRKTRGVMPTKLSDYVVGIAMCAAEETTMLCSTKEELKARRTTEDPDLQAKPKKELTRMKPGPVKQKKHTSAFKRNRFLKDFSDCESEIEEECRDIAITDSHRVQP